MPTASAPDNATPADWARPLYAEQIGMLGQMAQAGLRLALTIESQAQEQAAEASQPPQDALHRASIAFARASRAVRLTLMLQARLIQDLEARDKRRLSDDTYAETCARIRRDGQAEERKAQLERIVERIAERQGLGDHEVERLAAETAERLETDDIYGDVLARPVSELIGVICRDLGIDPDWNRLAQEAWVTEEMGDPPTFPMTEPQNVDTLTPHDPSLRSAFSCKKETELKPAPS